MTDHTVNVSIDDDIASIILDRAEVRNALNRDTMTRRDRECWITI